MNNYNVLDRPLTPHEIDFISKHVVTKKKQKHVAFCLTKKGLVKDLSVECKKTRKDFREFSKSLPKSIKPKAPCKPGKVRINGRCVKPKIDKPEAPCKPGKVRINGRCVKPKIDKPEAPCKPGKVRIKGRCVKPKLEEIIKTSPRIVKKTKASTFHLNKRQWKTTSAKVFFMTAYKDFNPMIKTNINVNQNTVLLANKSALMNPINENQNVIKYIKKELKSGNMIPGDIVYVGTSYISRPFYGFGIIEPDGTIDMTFGSNDLTKLIYGSKDDKDAVKEDLRTDFAENRDTLDHDMALEKIFSFISRF
jgi:hypothetical protein